MVMFESHIAACTSDIYDAVATRKYTLDMQVRAYDLLDMILAMKDSDVSMPSGDAVVQWLKAYDEHKEYIESLIDEAALKEETEKSVRQYVMEAEAAKVKAEKAVVLHELAKETFAIWQSSGLFARQRALRRLRNSAGFRLESHRIGNYVAKTYDLMEEARRVCQKAEQAVFSANVAYKCRADVHALIALNLR